MKADIAYVQERFREFNVRMFDGKLPEPPIAITNAKTYFGVCAFRKHRKWNGKLEYSDPLFRKMMADINERFGRHISVSHRLSKEQQEQAIDNRPKKHVVASVVLKDGRTGIKVIPCLERHIRRYHSGMMASGKVSSIEFFQTTDPFFNRFPSSSAFTVYFPDPDVLAQHLPDSSRE